MLMFGQFGLGAARPAAVSPPLPHHPSRPRPRRAAPCVGPLPNEERIGWEAAAYLALEAQERVCF